MTSKNTKNVTQQDDASTKATTTSTTVPPAKRPGPVRRNRKTSEIEKQTNGRTHEENQERAYIAASRRSDRSIEARLESARRASEIHKRRCGRGLKVTEEAVMNEEMYEEEDPDYEQRVSRLRMVMNTPNYPYAAYSPMQQYYPLMMPPNMANSDGNNPSTPGTPGAPGTTMDQQHPQHQFLFSPWFNQSSNGMNQISMSPGGTNMPGPFGPMSPILLNYQTPMSPTQQSPTQQSAHFLPPTQFPQRQETRSVPKSAYPTHAGIPESEMVFDSAPLDLFADVNLDGVDPNDPNDMSNWYTNNSDGNQQDWRS